MDFDMRIKQLGNQIINDGRKADRTFPSGSTGYRLHARCSAVLWKNHCEAIVPQTRAWPNLIMSNQTRAYLHDYIERLVANII